MFRKLCAAFALTFLIGCSSTPITDAVLFQPSDTQAKVFLYMVYDDPENKPFLPETFRFHVTGFDGEFDDHRFVRTNIEPGEWTISVDEVDWGGNVTHTFSHKTHVQAGKLFFYAAHIGVDGKLRLYKTDPVQGARDIKQRQEDCNC